MVAMRGGGRTNAAGGAWGAYAEAGKGEARRDTPLNTVLSAVRQEAEDKENSPVEGQGKAAAMGMKRRREDPAAPEAKYRRLVARSRFGDAGMVDDGKGIERLDVRIEDGFPAIGGRKGEDEEWSPDIRVTFHGSHVFAGIRKLVERGVIDGKRMPGWMTGEEGVSVGVVRDGRIVGFKGSGL